MRYFRQNVFTLLIGGCLLGGFGIDAAAQEGERFDPVGFEIALGQAETPEGELALVEQAIVAVEQGASPDLRLYFDLNARRLELLIQAERVRDAASLAEGMAQFAGDNRDTVARDPVSLYRQAAELYEAIGNIRKAMESYEAEVKLRLDAGQSGDPVAEVYAQLERLATDRGDSARAEGYYEQRQAMADPKLAGVRAVGETGFSEVEVFYATDRARSGESDPNEFYGYGRSDLEYGIVTVSIPNEHVPGAIERPSIWRLEFGANPAKHVMVRKVDPLENDDYFNRMQARVKDSARKEAFVFVHGFNTRFDAAARRAAQLAYDMNYSGVPVLYSWPSAGKTFRYVADTAVVRLSGRRLAVFLEELKARSGAETIHIVAHSMGNRALTDALELLAMKTNAAQLDTPPFGQLFFAAPDVDADLFREMLKTIKPMGERMTLYASEEDWALTASRKLHGNAPRAGQAGDTILSDQRFDTVDMTTLGEDMLAHTYFANDSSALADIVSLIWANPEPNRRCGLQESVLDGSEHQVWQYQKGVCQDGKIVKLIAHLWNLGPVSNDTIRQVVASHVSDREEAELLAASLIRLAGGG